jgi:Putative zinc-binding metallo-peptidase
MGSADSRFEGHVGKAGVVPAIADHSWASLKDEELLALRISDLGVCIGGSELEERIAVLYDEIAARRIRVRPVCYLADEWFSPAGVSAIALPFYLAHPRLKALELHQMLEVEGGTPDWCLKLLRHECGHALDHAYAFSQTREWVQIFGSPEEEYKPEYYRPRHYSRSYVRHLPKFYAQAHPDEDFAETFAVWLAVPAETWREQYRGWKALQKLEYVDGIMRVAAEVKPRQVRVRKIAEAAKSSRTLKRYYAEKRRLFAEDFPDAFDDDLRRLFNGSPGTAEPASSFLRRNRRLLVASVVRWTGQPKYAVDMVVRRQTERCGQLGLAVPSDSARLSFDLGSYLAALLTNYRHTGRFRRLR